MPKVHRRKKIISDWKLLNEIETKKTAEKLSENKSWFSEKVKKIDQPLSRLTKKKERSLCKIRNKREEIARDITELQMIIREYYEQLFEQIEWPRRNGQILRTIYTLPRLNDEETGADSFTGPFYQTFKEDLTLSLSNSSQKLKRKKHWLWGQHHSDTKIRPRQHTKMKITGYYL